MGDPVHTSLPYDPLAARPLPGVQPAGLEDWLYRDDAHATQMARRDALLASRHDEVHALSDGAFRAAVELLELVLARVHGGARDRVIRADGAAVVVDRARPLETLCRLVQEDFCILQKHGDEHVLTGAILCFPASWTLSEKFMRPLVEIHAPVASYDTNVARRVQRLFDGARADRILWRCNALWYRDAELFQPRRAAEPRQHREQKHARVLRSERQSILRLPRSGAVVFSIHTHVLAASDLPNATDPAR